MKNIFIITIISLALFIYGCGNNASSSHDLHNHESIENHEGHDHNEHLESESHENHDHDHEADVHAAENGVHNETDHAGEIIFTQKQAALSDFQLFEVKPEIFHEVITASGQIMAAQGDEMAIVAPASGIISFGAKKISEGVAVTKGENLFYISSKNIAEGDYYARNRAAYEQAKKAYERAEKLIVDKLISHSEFEQAKFNFEQAKTAYEAIANDNSDKGINAKASISGFIKSIDVSDGQYVDVGQKLGVVSQNRRLILKAEVSQKYYNDLRSISTANFKIPYNNELYSLNNLNGRLLSIGKASDANSAFIPVTFEFDNKGNIPQGIFVEVYLISSPINNAIVIPLTALVEEQGSYYVYIQIDAEGYMKREVKLGANDGNNVRILSGLQAGETIVSKGAQLVRAAAASGTIPHGHSHSH